MHSFYQPTLAAKPGRKETEMADFTLSTKDPLTFVLVANSADAKAWMKGHSHGNTFETIHEDVIELNLHDIIVRNEGTVEMRGVNLRYDPETHRFF